MSQPLLLYEGPSLLGGGEPIVVIATGLASESRNVKTGPMVQTWILLRDTPPIEGAASGADSAICGGCSLRAQPPFTRRSCYVNVGWAPNNIWKAYKRGGARDARRDLRQPFEGGVVRLGAYGDPAAAPAYVWHEVLAKARGWTGYTHQWYLPHAAGYRGFLMASVDSAEEAEAAQSWGWRTFRLRLAREELLASTREVVCPASDEAGNKTTCAACRLCDGGVRRKAPSVAIIAHGPAAGRLAAQRTQVGMFAPSSVEEWRAFFRNAGGAPSGVPGAPRPPLVG
jgi:hypothetical protein